MKQFILYLAFLFIGLGTISAGSIEIGKPPTQKAYQGYIKAYFSAILKDPNSAKISYLKTTPVKAWYQQGVFGDKIYGYLVVAHVNAKNSYGGYAGDQRYGFLFKDGVLIKAVEPNFLNYLHLQ